MYFELLQSRLIAHVQLRVHRGELTERGLARHTGISQPHLHNMLNGRRMLSPQMADILLHYLHITLLDLLNEDELAAHRRIDRFL
jgi:plasmid maintenance system antidote protein VapI